MQIEPNTFICADSIEVLREIPDGFCNLCLTDPPYGIKYDAVQNSISDSGRVSNGGAWKKYEEDLWDNMPPSDTCLSELRRVSKHQIVWGGNYMKLPLHSLWLIWNKIQRGYMTDGEMAWTSKDGAIKIFDYCRADAYINFCDGKYHPTQKPVPLFVWCIKLFSKPGDLVIDPFCGSGTTALACHKTGRQFICIDREQKYIDIAQQRYADLIAQQDLFGENQDGAQNNSEGRGTACNRPSTPDLQLNMDLV